MRENIEKPYKYFLSDLMDIKGSGSFVKQANRDAKKLRKLLQPILTVIYENKYELSDIYKDTFRKNIFWVLKKIYLNLPREDKEIFLGSNVINVVKENHILEEKFSILVEEASELLRSFRNFTMHNFKYVSKDEILKQFHFSDMQGILFSFLRLCAKSELNKLNNAKTKYGDKLKIVKEMEYWNKILSVDSENIKSDVSSLPFVYILSSIAMFVDFKDMQEILNFMRVRGFISKFTLKFSVRINSRANMPGFFEEDNSLTIYKKQIEKDIEIESIRNSTNKRLLKDISFFTDDKESIEPKGCVSKYYHRLIWYYNFSRLYPRIDEFEKDIKESLALDIQDYRLNRIEEIRQNNIRTGKKSPLPNIVVDIDKIKSEQIQVYKNDNSSSFMREAVIFLKAHNPTWFGNNWHISGNNVVWYEPSDFDNIEFDIRRRTKPAMNSLNSIYKVKCKSSAKEFKIIHLGYRNLLALLCAFVLGRDVDFEALKNTAKISTKENKNKKTDTKSREEYFKYIENNSIHWNNYKKISFIAKFLRLFFKNRLHLNESIEYHRDILMSLNRIDSQKTIIEYVKGVFDKRGETLPTEIADILSSNDIDTICKECINHYAKNVKEKQGGNKTHKLSYTWKTYAFHPSRGMDADIRAAIGWEEEDKGDLFDLLNKLFIKKNYQYPNIIPVYFKNREPNFDVMKVLISCRRYKELKREREIREKLSAEFLYTAMAFGYLDILKNNNTYTSIEIMPSQSKKIPTDFNIVFNTKPKKLKVSFDDYLKKDVRAILSWAFDSSRIGYDKYRENSDMNKKILAMSDIDKASTALNALVKTNDVLLGNDILRTKAPKYYLSNKDYYDIEDLKAFVKRSLWVQKELLFLISGIEKHLTWILDKNEMDYEFRDGIYYYNFEKLVKKFQLLSKDSADIVIGYKTHITNEDEPKRYYLPVIKKIDILPSEISLARTMLSYGSLVIGNITSFDIINAIELTNKILYRKSIQKVYENKMMMRTGNGNNYRQSGGEHRQYQK